MLSSGAADRPMLVVQQQMVGMTEEYPVGEVGVAVAFRPLVGVVGFAPGR